MADLAAHGHGPRGNPSVAGDDANLISALKLADRALGNQARVDKRARVGPNTAVLAGAQDVAGVRKRRAQANRAGLEIYFAIGRQKRSLLRIDAAVAQDQLELRV